MNYFISFYLFISFWFGSLCMISSPPALFLLLFSLTPSPPPYAAALATHLTLFLFTPWYNVDSHTDLYNEIFISYFAIFSVCAVTLLFTHFCSIVCYFFFNSSMLCTSLSNKLDVSIIVYTPNYQFSQQSLSAISHCRCKIMNDGIMYIFRRYSISRWHRQTSFSNQW